ncbi:alpha/beta hydrolase [Xanthobacteraceae bacterium A53D]
MMKTTISEERITDGPAAGMAVRVYPAADARRGAPIALHLHGGTFVDGTLDCGLTIGCLLAEAGATVVSVAYPLACEKPFPHGLEAAYGALNWVYDNRTRWGAKKSKVFVAGEEAGGNLAAALALMARDQRHPPLAGQILLSPMLDASLGTPSLREAEAGASGCRWADGWRKYLGSACRAAHPYASPLGASRLAGVTPALVITSEDDPMRDEALAYVARLKETGVNAHVHVEPGPTGWPETLAGAEPDKRPRDARWIETIRALFAAFMADPATFSPAAAPAG